MIMSKARPLFDSPIVRRAIVDAFVKLDPRRQVRNPVMFTVLFWNFASGLNLYYAVQNVAALPQQWLLSREREKSGSAQKTAVVQPKRQSASVRKGG